MIAEVNPVFKSVADELCLSEPELITQSLRALLESQLIKVNAQILAIHGEYGICSIEEMDAFYRNGKLEEADSWRDFQRLGHLEFERDKFLTFIRNKLNDISFER